MKVHQINYLHVHSGIFATNFTQAFLQEGMSICLGLKAFNDRVEGLGAECLEVWRDLMNVVQVPLACHNDTQFPKSLGSYNKSYRFAEM